MAYQTRFARIMDLLRQEGDFDEARFLRTARRYGKVINNEFADLLTVDRRQELLGSFMLYIFLGPGYHFPGDNAPNNLPTVPGFVGAPEYLVANTPDEEFLRFQIPHDSLFTRTLREMQARERGRWVAAVRAPPGWAASFAERVQEDDVARQGGLNPLPRVVPFVERRISTMQGAARVDTLTFEAAPSADENNNN